MSISNAVANSDFVEEIIPERMRSEDYIRRLLGARKNVKKELELMPWYSVPEQRSFGDGHLACVKYCGGKPQPRRKPYYTVNDVRSSDIRNDVNLLSYYSKNRIAAEKACELLTMINNIFFCKRGNNDIYLLLLLLLIIF